MIILDESTSLLSIIKLDESISLLSANEFDEKIKSFSLFVNDDSVSSFLSEWDGIEIAFSDWSKLLISESKKLGLEMIENSEFDESALSLNDVSALSLWKNKEDSSTIKPLVISLGFSVGWIVHSSEKAPLNSIKFWPDSSYKSSVSDLKYCWSSG